VCAHVLVDASSGSLLGYERLGGTLVHTQSCVWHGNVVPKCARCGFGKFVRTAWRKVRVIPPLYQHRSCHEFHTSSPRLSTPGSDVSRRPCQRPPPSCLGYRRPFTRCVLRAVVQASCPTAVCLKRRPARKHRPLMRCSPVCNAVAACTPLCDPCRCGHEVEQIRSLTAKFVTQGSLHASNPSGPADSSA